MNKTRSQRRSDTQNKKKRNVKLWTAVNTFAGMGEPLRPVKSQHKVPDSWSGCDDYSEPTRKELIERIELKELQNVKRATTNVD